MLEKNIALCNKLGLHARAAMKLTDLAMAFASTVSICRNGRCIDAKSIMEVMVLGAVFGQELTIQTEGSDEAIALEKICNLINNRFGESE